MLGPAGSGKSTAVEVAIQNAAALGANVVIACPTALLAFRYRLKFSNLDTDTLHGFICLHKTEIETLELLQHVDLLVIDEIGQVPTWIFDRLLRLWDATERRTVIVLVGDFCQLRGADPTSVVDSPRWQADVFKSHLRHMRRCKCSALKWKLELLRSSVPDARNLRAILRNHRAPKHRAYGDRKKPNMQDTGQILIETPDTTLVTISRWAVNYLNGLIVRNIFGHRAPLAVLPGEPDTNLNNFHGSQQISWHPSELLIFEGVRVTITRNIDKNKHFINGVSGVVTCMRRHGVEIELPDGRPLTIHRVHDYSPTGQALGPAYFPLRVGYATTLHKIQGSTLNHATIWLDVPYVKASAYVALSRVQYDKEWRFAGQLDQRHFRPADPA